MTLALPAGNLLRRLALLLSLALAGSSLGQVVITPFTDVNAFTSALNGAPVTVEDFTSTSHFPLTDAKLDSTTNLPGIGLFAGMIQPGVTYSTAMGTGVFFNIDAGASFTGGFLDTVTGNGPLTATFNGTVSAFGYDTATTMGSTFALTIYFSDATPYTGTFAITSTTPTFYGFQSTRSNITSLVLLGTDLTFSFAIDNFRFTNSNVFAVPEPGTAPLLGLGLAGCLLLRRRRSRT